MKISRETKAQEEKAAIEAARVERLAKDAKEHLNRQRLLSRLKDQPATTSAETVPEDSSMKSKEKADIKVKMEEFDEDGPNNREKTQPMEEITEAPDDVDPGSSDSPADGVEYIQVKWHEYDETTLEHGDTLLEDVPDIVTEYERRKEPLKHCIG